MSEGYYNSGSAQYYSYYSRRLEYKKKSIAENMGQYDPSPSLY